MQSSSQKLSETWDLKQYREFMDAIPKKRNKKKPVVPQFRPTKEATDEILTELFGYDPKTMIYLPGNVPSSKNGKVIRMNRKTGKRFVANNDTVLAYKKYIIDYLLQNKPKWVRLAAKLDPPIKLGALFIRNSSRGFDFNNATQVIADLMQDKEWLPNDSLDDVYFVPGTEEKKKYVINKQYTGVILIPNYGITK